MKVILERLIGKRGIKAGMLTFFFGPPIGGAALGLVAALALATSNIIGLVTGKIHDLSPILGAPLLILGLPILFAMYSYLVAALPAALAAAYVSIRVGMTAHMSWTETVVLSVVCLAYTRGAPGFSRWVFLLDDWHAAPLVPCSLFAALTLRYFAGRWGLVR